MKHLLLILALTTLTFASNPFDTMGENYKANSTTSKNTQTEGSKKFYFAHKAALKGNINAQFDLAMMYGTGSEVRKDERKAFNWLHKAAFNGHLEAKYLMGVSFKQGTGVRVQKELARYWFKKAAKAGHPKAMFQLAKIERSLTLNKRNTSSRYASNEF